MCSSKTQSYHITDTKTGTTLDSQCTLWVMKDCSISLISVNVWLCTTHSRGSQWVYVTLRTWLRTVLYVLLLLHATSLYECYILELLTVLCYRFMRVFLFIHTLDYMFFVVNLFFFSWSEWFYRVRHYAAFVLPSESFIPMN